MLTDSYDIQTKPIISPADFYGPQGRFCDVLDQPEYSVGDLPQANHALEKFHLALALALEV